MNASYSKRFVCPYCHVSFWETPENTKSHWVSYSFDEYSIRPNTPALLVQKINIVYHHCPSCLKYAVEIFPDTYPGKAAKFHFTYPAYQGIAVPDYVPEAIREDYKEACLIVNSSPKAAATLARRCLQGMIRDFWKIQKGTLSQEIDALKDKIPADLWTVLCSVRRIGNIGAHMEKDVNLIIDIEPSEAEKLLRLLELLIKEWYIHSHDSKILFEDILDIDQQKQEQRHQPD